MHVLPIFPRIRAVEVVGPLAVRLDFKDGTTGVVDVGKLLQPLRNLSLPLADPEYFAQVRVDHEAGTIAWPNGLDLDPDVLYARAHGIPVPGMDD